MDPELPKFRKRADGRWAIVGPKHVLVPGETVTVAHQNGTTSQVVVEEVTNEFVHPHGGRWYWADFRDEDRPPRLFD